MATSSKQKNTHKPKVWPIGYIAGTAVILLGWAMMWTTTTRHASAIAYLFIAAGLLTYIICGLVVPRGVKNNPSLAACGALFVGLAVLMAIDFWDELAHPATVGSGLGAGNGFLMDGLGVIVYYLAGPLCVIIGLLLLIINSIKKEQKSR
jgi:hypothetical protein